MTDTELYSKVAALEGWTFEEVSYDGIPLDWFNDGDLGLTINAAMFVLIKKYKLDVYSEGYPDEEDEMWLVDYWIDGHADAGNVTDKTLERAICLARLEIESADTTPNP